MYEYHKLVRMIVRAYHSVEDIIVLDGLCHLIELHDTPTNHSVTDKQIAQLLSLPEKRVQSVLTGLKQKQLIKLYAAEEESKQNEPLLEHISKRQKFPSQQRGPHHKQGLIWYIDYPHVLKVLQWRRYSVYQQLNQHVDQSAVHYTCPTPGCKNYGRQFALMELLIEDGMKGGEGGGFVCDGCEVEVGGKKQGTPLVVVGGATAGPTDNGSDGQESVKTLFNVQIQPISAQMKLVEQLLDEQAAHAEDVMAEAHAPRQLTATDDTTADITVDIAAAPGASAAAAGGAVGQQSTSVTSGGSRVLHVPTVLANQAKGVVAALPWAEGGVKGMEEERKREEETRRKEREDEEERQRQAEQARYQQQYDEELQRMKALHAAEPTAAAAADESMAVVDESEVGAEEAGDEVMVSVGGRQVPLSEITQADLENMTPEESAFYDSMYAGTGF